MKQERNTNKKLWVKRTWVNKNTYDFITISIDEFEKTVKALEVDINRGLTPMIRLEKTSWLYSKYRDNKLNAGKAIIFIIGAITGSVITELVNFLLRKWFNFK